MRGHLTVNGKRELLAQAADLLARYRFEFWTWGDSIGFEGLLDASDVLGDPRYEGWVHGALKAWAAGGRPFRELDNTAAGHAMCLTFERTGDDQILEAAQRLATFLQSRRRLPDGVFVSGEHALLLPPYGGERLVAAEAALLHAPGAAVYVDAMHMDPPFFTHLGALSGDDALIDLGADQALGHLELLQDEDSGLMWHFWLEKTQSRYCHGWGRGQGWAMLGLLDVLTYLPSEHAHVAELQRRFVKIAEGLAALQEPSGGWGALADDPLSGSESSTAGFATVAFLEGCRRGLLPDEFVERAARCWEYLWGRVTRDGLLDDVSAAVCASTVTSHYRNVPTGFMVPWGQGVLLSAARRVIEFGRE